MQDKRQICESVKCANDLKCGDIAQQNADAKIFDSNKIAFNIYKHRTNKIIEDVHISDTNFAENRKCAKGVLNMIDKNNTKVNRKIILAVIIALWLFIVGIFLGILFIANGAKQNVDAAPTGNGAYCIAVQVNGLNLSDELYAELKTAGWDKIAEYAYGSDSSYPESYRNTITYIVGGFVLGGQDNISTTTLNLPLSILEKSGKQVTLSSTFGGNTYEYTNKSKTMSGYSISDFSRVGSYYSDDLFALLVTISIEEPEVKYLNLTTSFENLSFTNTSLVLYVFNNDTNEILNTSAVTISSVANTLSLSLDNSISTVRITLAVPYLWEITWTGATSYVNKSAIVNVSSETNISAQINIIDGYNNIIIV